MNQDQIWATTEAPNFDRAYPGKGERIGPAWRWLWSSMRDGQWRSGVDLADDVCKLNWPIGTDGQLQTSTVKNLLIAARKAGFLSVEYRRVPLGDGQKSVLRGYYARADILLARRMTGEGL